MNSINDLECNHLNGTMGVTQKIKNAMEETAKQFVYIGFLLWEVKEYKYYYENGYESVYAYAEAELGFKRSSTKNFIAICETFCRRSGQFRETPTMFLADNWNQFKYSQLTEMLSMSAEKRKQATPDMTIKQLRELKREPEEPKQVPKVEQASDAIGQTSGQSPKTAESKEMHDASWWVPEGKDTGLKLVYKGNNSHRPWDIGHYDSEAEEWYDQEGYLINVTHWIELPVVK